MDLTAQTFASEREALLALGREAAAALAALLDPGGLSLDDLVNLVEELDAEQPAQALFDAMLHERPLPARQVMPFVLLYLRNWNRFGRSSLHNVWKPPPLTGDVADCEHVRTAFLAAADLAALGEPFFRSHRVPVLCERLDRLASAGPDREAAALWLPTAQLVTDGKQGAEYALRAAEAASRAGEPELLAVAASIRAIRLVAAGAESLTAFDAVDAALRHLAAGDPPNEGAFGQLGQAVGRNPIVQALLPMMLPIFARVQSRAESPHPIELVKPVWTRSLRFLIEELPSVMRPAIAAELARERLGDAGTDDSFALASWASWSFDHPYYRRAVPHGMSIERERDAELTWLVLRHESTHVLSMVGGLGIAVMAMRAAVAELELELWALNQRNTSEEFVAGGVAALGEPSPPTLALAAWQTDLLTKTRILQDLWNPWLEGIAIFSELADDPSADDDDTIVGELMTQLIDNRQNFAGAGERRAAFDAMRTAFEREFASIQDRLGPGRLQYYYWEEAGPKYVGGYLAVRSVVASWRATAGPMSGHAAMRSLLHLTRFATSDSAVPDLSLPPGEFAVAAMDAMLTWVRAVAGLDAAMLRFGEESAGPVRWVGLRPVASTGDPREADETAETLYRGRLEQALRPATEGGRHLKDYFANDLLTAWSGAVSMMPIGRATARFWLNRTTGHLVYVVRVAEHRRDTGEPSYDAGTVPLDEDTMAKFEAAMAARPFDRLTVYRFADLADTVPDRHAGTNLLAFRLGEWIHVQPAGWLSASRASAAAVDAIRDRLAPPPPIRMEAALLDSRGGAAARTAAWLGEEHEVGAAAARVRDHDGTAQEREASRRLVELVVGDARLAERLLDEGLRALTRYEVPVRSAAYRVMHLSGRAPAPAGELDLESDHPLRKVLACGTGGWDVVAIAKEPR